MIVDLSSGNSHSDKLICDSLLSLLNGKTCKLLRIDELTTLSEVIPLLKGMLTHICTINYLNHRNIVCNSVLKISLVMCRNRHNSTCSIACKYEISYKYRNLPAIYRVNRIYSLELTARLGLVKLSTIHIVFLECLCDVCFNLFFILYSRHKLLDKLSVRCKNHECDTIDCLYTGRVNGELSAAYNLKINLNAL